MPQDISLLNTAIGPVMRGPSSSHSAAPYMIGLTVRELALATNDSLDWVEVCFDPDGSFSQVYANQGSDEGFAAGISGVDLHTDAYRHALKQLQQGGEFGFSINIVPLPRNEHPNRVDLLLGITSEHGEQRVDRFEAVSLGGGVFNITRINDQPVLIDGKCAVLVVEHEDCTSESLQILLDKQPLDLLSTHHSSLLTVYELATHCTDEVLRALFLHPSVTRVRRADSRQCAALSDQALYSTVEQVLEDLKAATDLADLAGSYEARRLQLSRSQVQNLFQQRLDVMMGSVAKGFATDPNTREMKFLQPSAQTFRNATLPESMQSGFLKDAMAGALAVMEEATCRGVVCAAPTAGSAGIVPGSLYALQQAGASPPQLANALQVMALVGAVFAARGSYAAETGGCSVETGTSAAMAAAGVVHFYGGSAPQVFDAAALCLMNTLGLVCDPVGGEVEIPCHARNIAGVSHVWSATMAVLGGFQAVLPFDELVDMTVEIGDKMDADLRCTARGGCAKTPTAQQMVNNLIYPSTRD